MLQPTINEGHKDFLMREALLRHANSPVALQKQNSKEEPYKINKNVIGCNRVSSNNNEVDVKGIKAKMSKSYNNEYINYEATRKEVSSESDRISMQSRQASKPVNFANSIAGIHTNLQHNANNAYRNHMNYYHNNTTNLVFYPPKISKPIPSSIFTQTNLPHLISHNNSYLNPVATGCLIPQNVRPPSNSAAAGMGAAYVPPALIGSPFFHPPSNPSLLSPSNPVIAHFGYGGATNFLGLPNYLIPKENISAVKLQTTVVENKRRNELNAMAYELANQIATVGKSNPKCVPNLGSTQANTIVEKASDVKSNTKKRHPSITDDTLAYKGGSTTVSEYSYNASLNASESDSMNSYRSSRLSSLNGNTYENASRQVNAVASTVDNSSAALRSAPASRYSIVASRIGNKQRRPVAGDIKLTNNRDRIGTAMAHTEFSTTNTREGQKIIPKKNYSINTSAATKNSSNQIGDKNDSFYISSTKYKIKNNSLPPRHQPTKMINLNVEKNNLLTKKEQTRRSPSTKFINQHGLTQFTKQNNSLNFTSSVCHSPVELKTTSSRKASLSAASDTCTNPSKGSKKMPGNRRGSLSVRGSLVQLGKPLCIYVGQRSDEVDMKLQEWHNSHNSKVQWQKINKGLYYFGETEVHVDKINGKLMCCVDDATWNRGKMSSVEKFVAHFEPIERRRMERYISNGVF